MVMHEEIHYYIFIYISQGSLKSEGTIPMCLNYETRFSLQDIKTSWLHKRMLCHSSPKQASKIISFNLTDIGEGINEVTVKEWSV
jgi:hypothetical protein